MAQATTVPSIQKTRVLAAESCQICRVWESSHRDGRMTRIWSDCESVNLHDNTTRPERVRKKETQDILPTCHAKVSWQRISAQGLTDLIYVEIVFAGDSNFLRLDEKIAWECCQFEINTRWTALKNNSGMEPAGSHIPDPAVFVQFEQWHTWPRRFVNNSESLT